MYFHLVFRFCVDLVEMVKIMQKHAKLEQKGEKAKKPCNPLKEQQQPVDWMLEQIDWIKHVDRLLRPEENMSTGWCGSSAQPCGMNSAHSASTSRLDQEVVDWIIKHVDWMKHAWKNQSTGSWQRVQRINPSRREEQRNPDFQRSPTLKNHNSQSKKKFCNVVNSKVVANKLRNKSASKSQKSNG